RSSSSRPATVRPTSTGTARPGPRWPRRWPSRPPDDRSPRTAAISAGEGPDGGQHRPELHLRLGPLGVGVGPGHDPGAGHEAGPAPVELGAPERHRPLAVAGGVDPADRAGIEPAVE